MDSKFEKIFIGLVKSNYRLGQAEYNRNPSYNSQHFHHKAEQNMIEYLQEHNPELLQKILIELGKIEEAK